MDLSNGKMTVVSWNIRAGGGVRVAEIARQLQEWETDLAALSEFRGTPPSQWLIEALAEQGLIHQYSTVDHKRPQTNRLLVASRAPIGRLRVQGAPKETGRWLMVRVEVSRPFSLGLIHVPNRVSGLKYPFHDSVLAVVDTWRRGPAVLLGDTNTGRRGIDEEAPAFNAREEQWMVRLDTAAWKDMFRHLHGDKREYTWYSPNGNNGFRLDQAFANKDMISRVEGMRYAWGISSSGDKRRGALSDHAASIISLSL